MSALASRQTVTEATRSEAVSAPMQAQASFDLLVVFRLVGQCFGLMASNVREIINISTTTRVPNTAAHIEGVVNLRGRIVPVFNLQRKLALQQADSHQPAALPEPEEQEAGSHPRRTVMVVEEDGALCGLLVEEVTDVVKISAESVNTAASRIERPGSGYVLGTVTLEGGRLATLLSLEALLAD
ncbi:purine-binding chemotaxis protein CheW [bacterium]|nr:purine-binding chemotaxis protein CheW [bacterium]